MNCVSVSPGPTSPSPESSTSRCRRLWRVQMLAIVAALLLALQGCACISGGEYTSQCCAACGTLCTQVCIPVCVDTALGKGPFNSSINAVPVESEPAPAAEVTELSADAATVPY